MVLPFLNISLCMITATGYKPVLKFGSSTLYPKSNFCISKMKLRDLVPNYYIHVSVNDEARSACLAAAK
jgi:hypothetical protein